MSAGDQLFPGILGYDESVIPQIENAILAGQDLILLGERGQAKSRLIRSLTSLFDETIPAIAGCEINDNPYAPICRRCRDLTAEQVVNAHPWDAVQALRPRHRTGASAARG